MARFTQEQYQLCFNGMRDTLNPGEIERLLRYELDLELENIVSGSQNKLAIIKAVIKHVEQNDLETQLVQALVKVRPRNKQFQKLKQQLQKTVSPHVEMSAHPDQQKAVSPNVEVNLRANQRLEAMLNQSRSSLNLEQWEKRFVPIKWRVCRIELPLGMSQNPANSIPIGTGFLIASDVVLTCNHVAQDAIKQAAYYQIPQENIICRFDYREDDKQQLRSGQPFEVASHDFIIESSPTEQLDYALLRIKGTPGQEVVNRNTTQTRGCFDLRTSENVLLIINDVVLIVQHPNGTPLTMDIADVASAPQQAQRFAHLANTDRGSSGSPIFNRALQLIGLHRAGYLPGQTQQNYAVPIRAIVADLKDKSVFSTLKACDEFDLERNHQSEESIMLTIETPDGASFETGVHLDTLVERLRQALLLQWTPSKHSVPQRYHLAFADSSTPLESSATLRESKIVSNSRLCLVAETLVATTPIYLNIEDAEANLYTTTVLLDTPINRLIHAFVQRVYPDQDPQTTRIELVTQNDGKRELHHLPTNQTLYDAGIDSGALLRITF